MIVYTKESETKTYNQNGKIHGSSPIRGIRTPLTVSTNTRDIPERGECYQVLSTGAFILVADVIADVGTPPPPPPPTNKTPFALKVDGYKLYNGELERE